MYRTCIFCNQPLGENAVLEELPVGRRLAFDGAKGRLWVVCRRCERWNLSPLEERWEAIEACERLFREIRTRTSTENIGLARHAEGLELVRVGAPQRPEFAAWRYGDQFGRRRKRALVYGIGGAAVAGGVIIGGMAVGIIGSSLLAQSGNFVNLWVNGRTRLKLDAPDGETLKLKLPDLQKARFRHADATSEYELVLQRGRKKAPIVFRGVEAERVAGLMLPKINASGARARVVQDAVREIEETGHPDAYLRRVARDPLIGTGRFKASEAGTFGKLPTPTKLALEMALHEEHERRALEGELKALELQWQAAEEVAAIADDLLVPESAHRFLRTHRSGDEAPETEEE